MLVWTVEFSCWLILVKCHVFCCLLSWSLTLVRQSGRIELTHIMMVAICNLHVEYDHCTEKQMYENILNYVVKVTSSLRVSFASPSIAIKIMEDIGLCDDRNINSYLWLNDAGTVIVATTVVFVAHKYEFLCTF